MWGKTWSKKIDSNTQKHKQLPSSPALLHMQSVSSSTTRFNYIPIRQINLCLFSPPLQYSSKTIMFVNDFLKLLQRECSLRPKVLLQFLFFRYPLASYLFSWPFIVHETLKLPLLNMSETLSSSIAHYTVNIVCKGNVILELKPKLWVYSLLD